MDKNQILIILPAYNESPVIAKSISGIISAGYQLTVIDDGSTDNTTKIVSDYPCYLIRHPINLGQGAAIQTGITFGLKHTNCEIFVTFDADGQHQVEDIESLVKPIIDGKAEIVLGSRFLGVKPVNIPKTRRFFLKFATTFTRIVNRINVTDTHNGLRALSRRAAGEIKLTQNGMSHASEFLDIIKRKNISFVEVPVKILYSSYSLAKGQNFLNSINILWELFFAEKRK
jgi:glycosyltransferase involved in cell wall biosynthesis